jgi:hypothetical protein
MIIYVPLRLFYLIFDRLLGSPEGARIARSPSQRSRRDARAGEGGVAVAVGIFDQVELGAPGQEALSLIRADTPTGP